MNKLIWIYVAQDIVKLLKDVHLAYILYLAYNLIDQMNSDFNEQGKFGKPDLSTSIFKKTIFYLNILRLSDTDCNLGG